MEKFILKLFIILSAVLFFTNNGFCADIDLSKSFVSDKANIIDPQLKTQLQEVLKNLHKETDSDVVVITLNSIPMTENFLTIESQIKNKYILGGSSRDKWVMIIVTTNPYQMNIRVGNGIKNIITGTTLRAMRFEFMFSRLFNRSSQRNRYKGQDLYNTAMFLAELIADSKNVGLHIDNPAERDEVLGDLYYLLGGRNAHYFPKTDPTEKFIRRNNLHMVILLLIIGLIPAFLPKKRK